MPCCRVERGFRILSYIELMGRGETSPRLLDNVISYFFFFPGWHTQHAKCLLDFRSFAGKTYPRHLLSLCTTLRHFATFFLSADIKKWDSGRTRTLPPTANSLRPSI